MKYLIVKCDELSDAWECDANRQPICLTDDCSTYGYGYEVYEILSDNTFKLIKEYETPLEEGIAVVHYSLTEDDDEPIIVKKYPNATRQSKKLFKKIFKEYNFTDDVTEAYKELLYCGGYGEEINGRWWVITGYRDNVCFSRGY